MAQNGIIAALLDKHSESVLQSHELYAFTVGQIEALYDPYNRRLKLFELRPTDVRESELIASALACEEPNLLYSKIIVYAHAGNDFSELGLRHEAAIEGFFENKDDAELWCCYPDPDRAIEQYREDHDKCIETARGKARLRPLLPDGYSSAPGKEKDAADIARLLQLTFSDYPVPITPDRIAKLMADRSLHYRVIRDSRGEMVACASAEISHRRRSAELTDCATRDDQRGKGLMTVILADLESDLRTQFGITDVYTIARAVEVGMNCSFAKLGYRYTGRLINNCRMGAGAAHRMSDDDWESMNVWCRGKS